eukprot:TRINITY_DN69171_c0_g1_i1.p1 TRINITY_DN69171_c0_g1~~TRINITY_DN69171_c0_g1_i1.p1  ORF type:complete len:307 (-),score=62.73 TRINITY_DN69171_c0_g1_i1:36-956(-)
MSTASRQRLLSGGEGGRLNDGDTAGTGRRGSFVVNEKAQTAQLALERIQGAAEQIKKETNRMVGANESFTGDRQRVEDILKEARALGVETKKNLESDTDVRGLPPAEQNLRRLSQQKLTEAIVSATKSLESAWKAYQHADEDRKKVSVASDSNNGSVASTQSLGRGGVMPRKSLDDMELPNYYDCEAAGPLQQQVHCNDVSQAEVDMHTAISTEYAQQVTVLSQDIRSLQRAMVDLAEHTTQQGDTLDGIWATVSHAEENAQGATVQLQVAERSHKKGTKYLYWLLALALVLAIIIVIVVVKMHTE